MKEILGPSENNPPNKNLFRTIPSESKPKDYSMVKALKEHLNSITDEEFAKEWEEIEKLNLEGPSFENIELKTSEPQSDFWNNLEADYIDWCHEHTYTPEPFQCFDWIKEKLKDKI